MENQENNTFQKVNDLKTIKEELTVQSDELKNDMEQEIRVAQEGIRQKYSKVKEHLQDKIDEKNGEIDDLAESISQASFFNRSFIGILADLMTTYEGREYIHQKTNFYGCQPLGMDKDFKVVTDPIEVIVLDEVKEDSYDDNNLNILLEKGQIVVLQTSKNSFQDIHFYEANTKNHSLVFTAKMDKFAYLKEFIDYVIDWKVQNKCQYIQDPDLIELEREYLRKNKQKILLNYNMRANEERKALEQLQAERKDNLNKKLLLNNN